MKKTDYTSMRVLMMAAGTGGHVFPALAVAKQLADLGATIHWLGTPAGMENRLVSQYDYHFHAINMQGLRGNGIKRLLVLPSTLTKATIAAVRIIKAQQINVVMGFGGYVTAPGGLAAKFTGVPLIIHEQNAIAGMSNQYLAKLANIVLQAFEGAFATSNKVFTIGNPVRDDIVKLASDMGRTSKPDTTQPLRLLVVGGSLGAQAINQVLPEALVEFDKPIEVIHQCGEKNLDQTQAAYAKVNVNKAVISVKPFIDDMADAYVWADVVLCRAGALTVTEIATVGIPAIFVPLPHAVDDHQTANANYLARADAAFLLPQSQLTPSTLAGVLLKLTDANLRVTMAANGRQKAQVDAAEKAARQVIAQYQLYQSHQS